VTSQKLPERRPKLIDLNLLPLELQPRKVSKLSIGLVILTIVLACLIVPFIFMKANVDAECKPLQEEHDQLKTELNALYAIKRDADALQAQIDAAESKLATIKQDYETFQDNLLLWAEIIEEIDEVIPGKKVTLQSITQKQFDITLTGTATKDDYAWDFITDLENSPYFSGVKTTKWAVTGAGVSFTMIATLSGGGE